METHHNGKAVRAKQTFTNIKWTFYDNFYVVILYILLLILQTNCQTLRDDLGLSTSTEVTKKNQNIDTNVDNINHCHSCVNSKHKEVIENKVTIEKDFKEKEENEKNNKSFLEDLITTVSTFTDTYLINNRTEKELEIKVEKLLDEALSKDKYEIAEGIEIKTIKYDRKNESINNNSYNIATNTENGRALFSSYTYEYRLLQKIKTFIDTHILSINIPKAANLFGFRCKY